MSYSRYINSRFYTYWCDNGGEDVRDNQVLDVDCEHRFTYPELKADIEKCLDVANTPTDNKLNAGWGVPLEDLRKELKGYMERFIYDMEKVYYNEDGTRKESP